MQYSIQTISIDGTKSRIILIDVPNSDLFHFQIYLRSGYNLAPADKYDLPHIVEHCLFESNSDYVDSMEFKSKIEELGAKYNGYTTSNLNYYTISGPNNNKSKLINLLFSLVFKASIGEDVFQEQKKVIRTELEIYKNNLKKNMNNNLDCLILEGKLSYEDRIKALDHIKYEDAITFYNKFYNASNIDIVVCGDFSKDKKGIVNLVDKKLLNIKHGERFPIQVKVIKNYNKKILTQNIVEKTDYSLGIRYVMSPTITTKDYYVALFYLYLLFKGLGSRINHKSRKLGYTYSIDSSVFLGKGYLEFNIGTSINEDNISAFINMLRDEISDINNGNVSYQELKRTKGYINGIFLAGYRIEEDILNYYAQRYIMGIEIDNINTLIIKFKQITIDDIVSVGKQLFQKDNYIIYLIGRNAGGIELNID